MVGEKNRLLENFLSLGALQIVSYTLPLINLPYLSRVLGVEKFGLVFFAFAFMQYFIILTDYGFGLSATREIAVNRHNQNNLSNIFNSVNILKFILLGISFIILCLLLLFVPTLQANWLVFILSFFMVAGNALYPVWFFQGMERMKYITFLNILSKVIFVGLIFIFVKQESDYIIVPLFNSLGFIVSGLIGFIFAVKNFKLKLYIPSWKSILKQLKYSTEFFISRVSVSAFNNTNSFCLGLISSNIMVGYYVAAEKIYYALSGLYQPVNQALYPFIAKNKDIELFKKIFAIIVILNTFICSLMFIFAKYFIILFYGTDMVNAYKILRIFCFGTLIAAPHILLGYPLLGGMGYTKQVNASVVIASIIHICGLMVLYFSNHMNIYSIAIMATCTEYIVFTMRAYWVWKYRIFSYNGGNNYAKD